MPSFLLFCAVVASLAAGVLVAQGLCALMFAIFRIHATQVAATARLATARNTATQTSRLETLQG